MLEKIIFNLFAFTLFILIFIKFIRKNDTSYGYLLIMQVFWIAINFIELSFGKSFGAIVKLIMYLLSVILPIFFIWLEYKKKIDFAEVFYIIVAKVTILIGKEDIAKKYFLDISVVEIGYNKYSFEHR